MSRKIKKNGVMTSVSLDKNKKYKYDATGDLVESTGTLGDNEISMSGSKSSLRRAADMERNISILATTMLTTDNGAGVDSPAEVKAAAASDATTKANAALASAKSYADQAEADAESAASSDATSKANNAKSQAISSAASDATTKANNAKSQAISAAASDATTKANAAKTAAIAAVTNGAGAAFDTLVEIQNAMATDSELSSAISSVTSSAAATASADATTKANAALAAAKVYADANDANTTYTATQMRDAVKTVDGSGSGLDADLLDGNHASAFLGVASTASNASKAYKLSAGDTGPSTENLNTIADSVTTGQLEYRGFSQSSSNAPPVSDNANGVISVGQHNGGYGAQLAFSSNGSMYWRDNPSTTFGSWRKMYDSGNDGSGSGLDADLLDGVHGSQFLRSDATDTASGNLSLLAGGSHKGNHQFASASQTSTGYDDAGIEVREGGYGSGVGMSAPRIGMHWGGVVASNISMETDGTITIRNNPGTGYENFRAANISATGEVTAYYSDERLKNFSGKIENALDKVSQLNGYHYTGNDVAGELGYDTDVQQVGVSAQEVEAVMPEVVKSAPINSDNGTDYKTVQYERMVPLLIESIKELKSMVESQAAEIAKLKK